MTSPNRAPCAICASESPADVLAELPTTWVTGSIEAPLPGYACVVAKRHVIEPFDLDQSEQLGFWGDCMRTARALVRLYNPLKMNYEIHGNTIAHLHMHLYPRYAGDPYEGRPISNEPRFQRTPEELALIGRVVSDGDSVAQGHSAAQDREARMTGAVRKATAADVEAMLDLAEARRRQYARFHPRFHRPASGARDVQRPFFISLLDADQYVLLVHEQQGRVDGFLTGQLIAAPPVYDPGGRTCIVDDFAVETSEYWPEVGRQLLQALRIEARKQGAAQLVVVCAPEDAAKRSMLTEAGLGVVSEWLVASL